MIGVKEALNEMTESERSAANVTNERGRSNRLNIFGWVLQRNNFTDTEEDYHDNTQTIHMYAIAKFANYANFENSYNRREFMQLWLTAILCLLFVMLQHSVLYWVIFESSFPTCANDNDCAEAHFCGGDNCTNICGIHDEFQNYRCYQYESGCERLKQSMDTLSHDQIVVFAFVSILFGSILCEDMRESTAEMAILDHAIKNRQSLPLLTWLIRTTLYFRRFVLPWAVCGATSSILLAESFSTKDILLNFLAAGFFVETDNLLARAFLNHEQQTLIERELLTGICDDEDFSVSFMGSRIFGIVAPVVMVVVTLKIQEIMMLLEGGGDCGYLFDALSIIFLDLAPIISVTIWALAHLNKMGWEDLLHSTLELTRGTVAISLVSLVTLFSDRLIYTSVSGWALKIIAFSTIVAQGCFEIGVQRYMAGSRWFKVIIVFLPMFLCIYWLVMIIAGKYII